MTLKRRLKRLEENSVRNDSASFWDVIVGLANPDELTDPFERANYDALLAVDVSGPCPIEAAIAAVGNHP